MTKMDDADIDIMLARADNIIEGSQPRFTRAVWSSSETDYARHLITDLAAALRQRDDRIADLEETVSMLHEMNQARYG